MATLARIDGMNVTARQINNAANNVKVSASSAQFTFSSAAASTMDANNKLVFSADNLASLKLDGIYAGSSFFANDNKVGGVNAPYPNVATLQKDFYLHFMAITNASTEGVCIATLKVNGTDEFVRQGSSMSPNGNYGQTPAYSTATQIASFSDYTAYGAWYNEKLNYSGNNWASTASGQMDEHMIKPGDRSVPVILYNTYNKITYAIAEINGAATPWSVAQGFRGGYSNGGSIYVLMSKDCASFKVAFAVDGTFRGLLDWNKDYRTGARVFTSVADLGLKLADMPYSFREDGATIPQEAKDDAEIAARTGVAGDFNFFTNRKTWDAAYYMPLMSNDTSNGGINLVSAYHGGGMSTSELEAIFNFFGFAYTNPVAPSDADFLMNSKLVSSAEAKYNVANAVITTPDTTVTIPQTGDAVSSTGLILIASAILAAAAVGFVLSKRACR